MKALRISSTCQEFLQPTSSQASQPFSASILVGQLENQTYLLVDVLSLNFPQDTTEAPKTLEEYLKKPNDQEETPEMSFLNMISAAKMMLVGGLSVIGVLFQIDFPNFDNNNVAFKNLVDYIKEVSSVKSDTIVIVQNKQKKKEEYLLYDFNQRKFSQIDYQFQNFKDRIFKLSTSVEVELIVPLTPTESGNFVFSGITEKLKQPIRNWTTDLSHGIVKVGGTFCDKTETLENIKNKLQIKDGPIECEIFSSLPIHKIFPTGEEENETIVTLKGIFTAYAYVLAKKVALKDAYQVLIADLLQSVQDKLNLFVNENQENLTREVFENNIHLLSNRVFLELSERSSNSFTYSDYLMSGETLEDSEQRLKDWFNLTPKYINTTEYTSSQGFTKKYIEFKQKK